MSDGPAGRGWDWLVQEARDARFTLIGEEHGVAETARFSARPSAPRELVMVFEQRGYSLVGGAPISLEDYWQIDTGADVHGLSAVSYPVMRVYSEPAHLPVYASVRLLLRDWPQYGAGVAFSATAAIDRAANAATLGPSGYPKSWVDDGLIDWEAFMTVRA